MAVEKHLDRAIRLARENRGLQQFGQLKDGKVHNGSTACTHTVCQFLYLYWHDEIITLNRVNRLAGMKPNVMSGKMARGMRPDEVRTFFRNADIPMVLRSNRPFKDLLAASKRGPLFYAIRYGTAPRRPGLMDLGNGFARPMKRGATQKGDGDMRHAVVMLGFREVVRANGSIRRDVFRKDPNHGSSVRPERPPYDVITGRQARAEYEAYRDVLGNALSAAWTRKDAKEPPFKAKLMVPKPGQLKGFAAAAAAAPLDPDDDFDPNDAFVSLPGDNDPDDDGDLDDEQDDDPMDLGDFVDDDLTDDPVPGGKNNNQATGVASP